MAGKIEERHNALRRKLVEIAEKRVIEGGIDAVKARDLATQADCALGAIYNVFGDMRDIILAVNGRTFQRLGNAVQDDLHGRESDSPTERLIAIAEAYLAFATANTNIWRALFDVPFSAELEVPQWYWTELDRLYHHISGPVGECFPDMPAEDQQLMTRALFSSVHGIVSLGIENRAAPLPHDELTRMITLLIQVATGNK